MIRKLQQRIFSGGTITREEARALSHAELTPLCAAANQIRIHFCGSGFDLCSIVNGKSGRCSEDCKYCAQSSRYPAEIGEYALLGSQEILRQAGCNASRGALRFSIVTSGRSLSDPELAVLCGVNRELAKSGAISLCASHGLLRYDQFVRLREAGVTRYHNNLETSRRNFPNICTTHRYEDKIEAIQNAKRAGLDVCSGGIIGMGETMDDRIDLALELRNLGVRSVPINLLNPIKGTPFAHLPVLTAEEVSRTVAIFRFLLPDAALRLAGGRGRLPDKGEAAFLSGANAAISGDMLTTSGIGISDDLAMAARLGFEVRKL